MKNVIVIVSGVLLGSLVNMGLIQLGSIVIPPPDGIDLTTEAGLKAGMSLMQPRHFIFPFLAHAFGSLSGTFIATRYSASKAIYIPLVIGGLFFVGGLMMIIELPSPIWFNIIDLAIAYFPMALLGWKFGKED